MDTKELNELITRYRAPLIGYLVTQFGISSQDAEDICQESLQRAYLAIDSYDPRYSFNTWLFSIARHATLDHFRRIASFASFKVDQLQETLVDEDAMEKVDSPEESLIQEQTYAQLYRVVRELPENYRTVAEMRIIQCYPYQEIAEATGLPLNTVRTRIARAKALIIERMK
ncbi:MAG: sigma-70 family RNA polymerase sigma factor [Bacteroidales bacterium]|nr:sigma-70 family RNA polymerase sigma factor [Bacteroidales bacterium]